MKSGWHKEGMRHSLASKGIKTNQKKITNYNMINKLNRELPQEVKDMDFYIDIINDEAVYCYDFEVDPEIEEHNHEAVDKLYDLLIEYLNHRHEQLGVKDPITFKINYESVDNYPEIPTQSWSYLESITICAKARPNWPNTTGAYTLAHFLNDFKYYMEEKDKKISIEHNAIDIIDKDFSRKTDKRSKYIEIADDQRWKGKVSI